MYYQVWGWGQELSYCYAGIGRTKFDNALKAGGAGIVKLGRKVWLTDEIAEAVRKEITEKTMKYHSVRKEDGGEGTIMNIITTHIKAAQHNGKSKFC